MNIYYFKNIYTVVLDVRHVDSMYLQGYRIDVKGVENLRKIVLSKCF